MMNNTEENTDLLSWLQFLMQENAILHKSNSELREAFDKLAAAVVASKMSISFRTMEDKEYFPDILMDRHTVTIGGLRNALSFMKNKPVQSIGLALVLPVPNCVEILHDDSLTPAKLGLAEGNMKLIVFSRSE